MKHKKGIRKQNTRKQKKFNSNLCNDTMTFNDCELAILRHAVDESELMRAQLAVNSEEVQHILSIVEKFIIKKKLICYGGTAINNILPKHAQFYNRDVEIPDYDFFSVNALSDAKELADIYYKAGYTEVEAKSGIHMGTFKVFVNFIPIADITQLDKSIYKAISEESIQIAGIHYAPPNYLRMSMFLELSRPAGDVSRWEKVLKRLNLLNEYYPLNVTNKCNTIDFQRKMESSSSDSEKLYVTVRDTLISQDVIFFGGYATSLYSRYMPEFQQRLLRKVPDFDVLSEDPDKCATIVKESLIRAEFKDVKLIKHDAIGETIPECIEIQVGKETIAFIYHPISCHSYNEIVIGNQTVHIATIDTILSFYLSFLYNDMHYYDKDRLLCMADFLFKVELKNRLEQKGLLKRFSTTCYGKQMTIEEIRAEKAMKFKELKGDRNSKEFKMWFLKYNPGEDKEKGKAVKPAKTVKVDKAPTAANKTRKNSFFF